MVRGWRLRWGRKAMETVAWYRIEELDGYGGSVTGMRHR